jgi:hypothetical protein
VTVLLGYVVWNVEFTAHFANGDPSLDKQSIELRQINDATLLQIAAVGNAQIASTWSKTAGHYILLFHCSLAILAVALLGVAILAKRASNPALKRDGLYRSRPLAPRYADRHMP